MEWREKLRELVSGKNAAALSRAAGLPDNAIRNAINSGNVPRADKAVGIARVLGVPSDWLFSDDNPPPPRDALDIRLIPDAILIEEIIQRKHAALKSTVPFFELIEDRLHSALDSLRQKGGPKKELLSEHAAEMERMQFSLITLKQWHHLSRGLWGAARHAHKLTPISQRLTELINTIVAEVDNRTTPYDDVKLLIDATARLFRTLSEMSEIIRQDALLLSGESDDSFTGASIPPSPNTPTKADSKPTTKKQRTAKQQKRSTRSRKVR